MFSSTRVKLATQFRRLKQVGRTMSTQSAEPKRDVVGILFFTGICLGSAGLGAWQVQRYQWKVQLIERIKNSTTEPPAIIGDCNSQKEFFDKTQVLRGQRVLITGKFDHSKEVFLGLRTAPTGLTGGPAQGMASNPQGYFVVTPLVRQDGCTVYINRGWVPRKMYSHQQWQMPAESEGKDQDPPAKDVAHPLQDNWDRPEGQVSVVTVIGEGEKPSTFSPVNAVNTNILLWLEPAALLRAANAPSFEKESAELFELSSEAERGATFNESGVVNNNGVQSTSTGAGGGLGKEKQEESVDTLVVADALGADSTGSDNCASDPVFPYAKSLAQLQEQIVAPETHFVYAATWFSLAAAGLVMTYFKFRRGGAKALKRK